jgi:uncharacterized glyoxalase superfamily protein PhnB
MSVLGRAATKRYEHATVRAAVACIRGTDTHGGGPGWVYVAVADPDAHVERARSAGAEVLGNPHEAFDGAHRGYSARDLEGNLWSFGIDRPGG